MPHLELYTRPLPLKGLAPAGDLLLVPSPTGLTRVPLRQLTCMVRVPPRHGVREAVIDTGAPLTIFPFAAWSGDYGWRVGSDYEVLTPVGGSGGLTSRVLHHQFRSQLVRLRVPVVLTGRTAGVELRVDGLIAQLAEAGGPPHIILGLWGNALDGRSLHLARTPDDDLAARLDF